MHRDASPLKPASPTKQSLRQRVSALRNLGPFLKQVWQTSPALTCATVALRLARAALPVTMLYVAKLIIDEVIALAGTPGMEGGLREAWASGALDHLALLLAAEFGLALLSDVLGRAVGFVDSTLSELYVNAASVRLMEHAATLDLEDFEDSELQDQLDRARRQTSGRSALMGQLFGQAQDIITVIAFAAGLVAYAPWLIGLMLIALLPAFLGEMHFNAQGYALNFHWTPERRELDYVRQTGASVESAKEVKIFGLERFLVARYRMLAEKFYRANRALALRRAAWGSLLSLLGTAGYYGAYGYLAWRTVHGDFTVGDLTFLACARCWKASSAVFPKSQARRCIWMTCIRSSASARKSSPDPMHTPCPNRSSKASYSRTSVSAIRARSAGPCGISRSIWRPANRWHWSVKTVRARPRSPNCWHASTTRTKAASCSMASICATTTWTTCAPTSA